MYITRVLHSNKFIRERIHIIHARTYMCNNDCIHVLCTCVCMYMYIYTCTLSLPPGFLCACLLNTVFSLSS